MASDKGRQMRDPLWAIKDEMIRTVVYPQISHILADSCLPCSDLRISASSADEFPPSFPDAPPHTRSAEKEMAKRRIPVSVLGWS